MHLDAKGSDTFPAHFSLRLSAAPATWGGGTAPHRGIVDRRFISVEANLHGPALHRVEQATDGTLRIDPTPCRATSGWFTRTFRPTPGDIAWRDPVIAGAYHRAPGMWSLTDGGLFPGLLTSIIGQSISVASAFATQRRLARSFSTGLETDGRFLVPLPTADQLAEATVDLIRASGVTWKRAEAIKVIAREEVGGSLPGREADPDIIARELRTLPMVGPWTAASALLWGLGEPDAFPSGDVALLRAARLAYDHDGMTMKDLDSLSEGWRPYRAIAARLLWTELLGAAW